MHTSPMKLAAALARAGQGAEDISVFTAPGSARIEYWYLPLYLALLLLLFRLIRRIRFQRASLTDRIRMQLEDIFCLIKKRCPGERPM